MNRLTTIWCRTHWPRAFVILAVSGLLGWALTRLTGEADVRARCLTALAAQGPLQAGRQLSSAQAEDFQATDPPPRGFYYHCEPKTLGPFLVVCDYGFQYGPRGARTKALFLWFLGRSWRVIIFESWGIEI